MQHDTETIAKAMDQIVDDALASRDSPVILSAGLDTYDLEDGIRRSFERCEPSFQEDDFRLFTLSLPVCDISLALYTNLFGQILKALPGMKGKETLAEQIHSLPPQLFPITEEDCSSATVRIVLEQLYNRFQASIPLEQGNAFLQAYFGSGCTLTELRELGLAQNLTTGDRFDVLLVLLNHLHYVYSQGKAFDRERFLVLQINEIDHVLSSTPADIALFTNFLSLLVSQISYCVIWLNSSYYADPSFWGQIQQALGYRFTSHLKAILDFKNLRRSADLTYNTSLLTNI